MTATISPAHFISERAKRLSRTPSFVAWFGKSKIVDDEGLPLVVYHGTSKSFDAFGKSKIESEGGFFFSSSPDHASEYVEQQLGANVIPAYLKIENPYTVSSDDWNYGRGLSPEEAATKGYDGYKITDQLGGDTYIAFEATQIKSAIGNRRSFDPRSPSLCR